MKKIALLFVATLFSVATFAQTKYNVDSYHSFLNFSVGHLGISFVDGRMDKYDGSLEMKNEDITTAKFNFTIDANSVNTGVQMRDDHLRSADFFEVEKYPDMTFESTKILATGKPDYYLLHGKLTIKDVTKDVIFDVQYGGKVKSDEVEKIGVKAKTTINRFDYNIDFDPAATGVGKDVSIIVHGQFVKQ